MKPKELMISRYEAFKNKDWQYLENTSLNQKVTELQHSANIEWLRLDVLDAYDNIVEFKAYFRELNQISVLHEKSSFIKIDNIWKYDSGILFNSKVQRNESCPCGSGKKFKKCCMVC